MVTLIFKKIQKDAEGKKVLYVCDYLDIKYTISYHVTGGCKLFIGFRQDDSSFAPMHDYKGLNSYQVTNKLNDIYKKGWGNKFYTEQQIIDVYVNDFATHIGLLYGFTKVVTEIHDYANLLIEQWLTE